VYLSSILVLSPMTTCVTLVGHTLDTPCTLRSRFARLSSPAQTLSPESRSPCPGRAPRTPSTLPPWGCLRTRCEERSISRSGDPQELVQSHDTWQEAGARVLQAAAHALEVEDNIPPPAVPPALHAVAGPVAWEQQGAAQGCREPRVLAHADDLASEGGTRGRTEAGARTGHLSRRAWAWCRHRMQVLQGESGKWKI